MSLLEVGRAEKPTAASASGVITEFGFGLVYGSNPGAGSELPLSMD